jgi:hypothetical protein
MSQSSLKMITTKITVTTKTTKEDIWISLRPGQVHFFSSCQDSLQNSISGCNTCLLQKPGSRPSAAPGA